MECTKADCLYFNNKLKECSIKDNDPENCFSYVTEEDYKAGEKYFKKAGK